MSDEPNNTQANLEPAMLEKIAPRLVLALEDYNSQGRQGLEVHMNSLGLVSALESPKPSRSVVFLHCDPNASFDHLAPYGIEINQSRGRVRTGILPLEQMYLLAAEKSVKRIIPAQYLQYAMDKAAEHVHLPDFRQQSGMNGKGVVIGVIDTGIDPNHAAFAGRILRVWDQTLPGPGVLEGGYGFELNESTLTVSRDRVGHGTHVAGIAAGSRAPYSGVAPEASLVIVKTDMQDAHVFDGVQYIFRIAQEMNRPAVINLSMGKQTDAHDGSDPLSMIIESESGPGRIVCCAAGNEGDNNIHAQVNVRSQQMRNIRFHVPDSQEGEAVTCAIINGWYAGADRIEVSVRTPGGNQTPFQGPVTDGASPSHTYDLPDGRIRIVTPGPDLTNGDHNFLIEIYNPQNTGLPLAAHFWQVYLRGIEIQNGKVDMWIVDSSPKIDVFFTGDCVQDAIKIGSPGACKSAITVASYTTRNQWIDFTNASQVRDFKLNDISSFSSEGPLRDGDPKPDVAAPGAMIIAPLSCDSPINPSLRIDEANRIDAGTSMATPFITGLVALLLERNPQLTPEEAKELLQTSASIPRKKAGSFHPKWGYGLVDCHKLYLSPLFTGKK